MISGKCYGLIQFQNSRLGHAERHKQDALYHIHGNGVHTPLVKYIVVYPKAVHGRLILSRNQSHSWINTECRLTRQLWKCSIGWPGRPGFGIDVSVKLCKLQWVARSMKCVGWPTSMHPSGTSTITNGTAVVHRACIVMTRRIDFLIDLQGGSWSRCIVESWIPGSGWVRISEKMSECAVVISGSSIHYMARPLKIDQWGIFEFVGTVSLHLPIC